MKYQKAVISSELHPLIDRLLKQPTFSINIVDDRGGSGMLIVTVDIDGERPSEGKGEDKWIQITGSMGELLGDPYSHERR